MMPGVIHDVAVIGAGLAGLSAARHLSDHGRDVVIIEKSRGLGGRAATRRTDLHDGTRLRVDHGAQFFTARNPLFREQVAAWTSRGICFEWASGFHSWDGTALKDPEESLGEPRYACGDGMSALGKDLAQGLRIVKEYRVRSVARDQEGWLLGPVEISSGEPIRARALFCSPPVPQSLELLGDCLHGEEKRFLEAISYGPCLAVMAFFAEMPPTPRWKGIKIRDASSPLSWMAWDSSRRAGEGPAGSVVLHASPGFSARDVISSGEGRELAAAEMIREASRIGGAWLGQPTSVTTHFWRYALPSGAGHGKEFLRSLGNRPLYLIGDGFGGGRVEDAWISGLMAARNHLTES